MLDKFDIWLFLAGLGGFLFGLFYLEKALRRLAGRSFKIFLREQTTNPLKGILSGTVITAVLQSSSAVTLMLLAFVGAGILSLQNALGVIFGANLGTTFTGWIVALLGFELDVAKFAIPSMAIGGILLFFTRKVRRLKEYGRFLFGFGLLFIGLSWMKESIAYLPDTINLSAFRDFNPYWFFILGLILTMLIQSSSATMVITMSAVYSGIIGIEAAAAMVIGGDLGTTVTVILGSVNGSPDKKRVAAGHFLFNLITDVIALLMMYPMLWFIQNIIGIQNPLFVLVGFHSLFNMFGIVILLPFIPAFSKMLNRRFVESQDTLFFISRVPTSIPEAAITALEKEIDRFIRMTLHFNGQSLNINLDHDTTQNGMKLFSSHIHSDRYDELKRLEGEIVSYYVQILNQQLEENESARLNRAVLSLRHAMQSAKCTKDITHNIRDFENSGNDALYRLYGSFHDDLRDFYMELSELIDKHIEETDFEKLLAFKRRNQSIYSKFLQETYNKVNSENLSEIETSTILNVNREVYNANKSIIDSIKDHLLSPEQAKDFEKLPEIL